jgi:hypothetical protein
VQIFIAADLFVRHLFTDSALREYCHALHHIVTTRSDIFNCETISFLASGHRMATTRTGLVQAFWW